MSLRSGSPILRILIFHSLLGLTLALSAPARANLLDYVHLDRDVEVTCSLDLINNTTLRDEQFGDPKNNDPWVTGVVAELLGTSAEAIGIADQNSFASSGVVSGTIHAEGFASGSMRTGTWMDAPVDDGKADGQSRFSIAFRVSSATSYVLTGSIWSSGRHANEPWSFDRAGVQLTTTGLGSEELDLFLVDGQRPFLSEGILLPGITYRLEAQVDAFARAEYDHDTGTDHSSYAAAGFDFDLFLQSSDVPNQGLSFGALKGRFR